MSFRLANAPTALMYIINMVFKVIFEKTNHSFYLLYSGIFSYPGRARELLEKYAKDSTGKSTFFPSSSISWTRWYS